MLFDVINITVNNNEVLVFYSIVLFRFYFVLSFTQFKLLVNINNDTLILLDINSTHTFVYIKFNN